jgi:TPP-dependent trihydroxycyclohexane-1,2-dione (THcHDO) dehydratase
MLWLVEGTINETLYMNDARKFEHRTLVEADTADNAERKYEAWWEVKTDEYSVYYQVLTCKVSQTII